MSKKISVAAFGCLLLVASANADNSLQSRCIDITYNDPKFPGATPRERFDLLSKRDLVGDIKKYGVTPTYENPWFFLKTPHTYTRTLGIYQAIRYAFSLYGRHPELTTDTMVWIPKAIEFFSEDNLKQVLKTGPRQGLISIPRTKEQLKEIVLIKRTNDETQLGGAAAKAYARAKACDGFLPLKCFAAFDDAYDKLNGRGSSYHLGDGWLVDVLLNESSARGGFRLVQKMLKRIRDADYKNANLIQDAYESFSGEGTPEESRKLAETFLLLGLVHGQLSWESYNRGGYIQAFNHASINAAHAMSMLAASLDTLVQNASPDKRLYTLPRGTVKNCDNGKAYHSIVPYYIATYLKRAGTAADDASRIPFIFEWGYQNFSLSLGRDPITNARKTYDDPTNQSHRLDLQFAGIGVLAGGGLLPDSYAKPMETLFNRSQDLVPQNYRPAFDIEPGELTPAKILKLQSIANHRFDVEAMLSNILNAP